MGVGQRLPTHRRIETILVLAMLVGACTGAVFGALTAVWTMADSKSLAGGGDLTALTTTVGAVLGLAVGVPYGVVWVVLARPEREVLVEARWAAALTVAAASVAVLLTLLPTVGIFTFTSSGAAAVVAYFCGPRLGVWRSAPVPPSSRQGPPAPADPPAT